MAIWLVIIGTVLSVFAVGLLYISFRAARFPAVLRLAHGKKSLARLLCLGFFTAATALLWATLNLVNAVVCLLHLVAFWMVCDLISFLITKICKRQRIGTLKPPTQAMQTRCWSLGVCMSRAQAFIRISLKRVSCMPKPLKQAMKMRRKR